MLRAELLNSAAPGDMIRIPRGRSDVYGFSGDKALKTQPGLLGPMKLVERLTEKPHRI